VARNRLVFGLAAVFAGLTAVLLIGALAEQPFLIAVALPFAATTYLLWSHATGRLTKRARRREAAQNRVDDGLGAGRGGFGDRVREQFGERTATNRGRKQAAGAGQSGPQGRDPSGRSRRAAGRRGAGQQRTRGGTRPPNAEGDRPTPAEARRVLGVSPEADQKTVRKAYRKQVKETHPDTVDGDEESFKRLNKAYERLKEE
jgi:hypothetical protein